MLLVASGLSVRGAIRLANADQGYEPEGLMTFEVALPEREYATDREVARFFEEVLTELRQIASVTSASAADVLPSSGSNTVRSVEIEPWTFAALTLTLGAISLLAGVVPARRALEVDPAVALRSE